MNVKPLKAFVLIAVLLLVLPAFTFAGGKSEQSGAQTTTSQSQQASQGAKVAPVSLDFACAPPDGSWYVIASAMWDVWKRNIPGFTLNILPGGGHGNVIATGTGKSQLGMASSTDVYGGYKGVTPFSADQKYPDLRMLFALLPSAEYVVVWKDSGMKDFADIRGKRINIKPEGYSSNTLHKLMVKAAGMTLSDFRPERVGDDDAINLMQDGHLDGMMSGGSVPDPAFIQLSSQRPISVLHMSDNLIGNIVKLNGGLFKTVIPAGSYKGVDQAVPTIGYTLAVAVNKNVSPDLVYQMTKTLSENFKTLQDSVAAFKSMTPKDMAKNLGVPFHPGAERYFKEQGWVN